MTARESPNCGQQHIRLAAVIIGVVLAICTATAGYVQSTLGEIDARIRIVERNDAANAARFEAIMARLDRLENRRP